MRRLYFGALVLGFVGFFGNRINAQAFAWIHPMGLVLLSASIAPFQAATLQQTIPSRAWKSGTNFAVAVQTGQVTHGPYADKEGWKCYKGETREEFKMVQCFCKAPCENDGMEDKTCMTFCTSPKCVCHTDSCELHR